MILMAIVSMQMLAIPFLPLNSFYINSTTIPQGNNLVDQDESTEKESITDLSDYKDDTTTTFTTALNQSSTPEFNPMDDELITLGSTTNGLIATQAEDGILEVLTEQNTGFDGKDYVDDNSPAHGTHSNFNAEKNNDNINDTLTEGNDSYDAIWSETSVINSRGDTRWYMDDDSIVDENVTAFPNQGTIYFRIDMAFGRDTSQSTIKFENLIGKKKFQSPQQSWTEINGSYQYSIPIPTSITDEKTTVIAEVKSSNGTVWNRLEITISVGSPNTTDNVHQLYTNPALTQPWTSDYLVPGTTYWVKVTSSILGQDAVDYFVDLIEYDRDSTAIIDGNGATFINGFSWKGSFTVPSGMATQQWYALELRFVKAKNEKYIIDEQFWMGEPAFKFKSNVTFTGVNTDITGYHHDLVIKTGDLQNNDGEALIIDGWNVNTDSWERLVTLDNTNTSKQLINVSIDALIANGTMTFRYRGDDESSSDRQRSRWRIDALFIHSWLDRHELNVMHSNIDVNINRNAYRFVMLANTSSEENFRVEYYNGTSLTWTPFNDFTQVSGTTLQWYNQTFSASEMQSILSGTTTFRVRYTDNKSIDDNNKSFLKIEVIGLLEFDNQQPFLHNFGVNDHANGTVIFWANASDAESQVSSITLQLNATTNVSMSFNQTLWIYKLTNPTYNVSYSFQIVQVVDSFGNANNTLSPLKFVVLNKDIVTPVIHDRSFDNTTNTFIANVTDPWGKIKNVTLEIEWNATSTERFLMYFNSTTGLYEKNVSIRNSTFQYRVLALDELNNNKATSLLFIDLGDIFAPLVHSLAFLDYGNGSLTIVVNATDDSSVASVAVWINGTTHEMNQNASNPMSWFWKSPILNYNALLTVSVSSATDSIGNVNNTINLNATHRVEDRMPPILMELSDTAGNHLKGLVTFSINATEPRHESQINQSRVVLTIFVISNNTKVMVPMQASDGTRFTANVTFNYNDTFKYWVNVSDNAGNNVSMMQNLPRVIWDIIPPEGDVFATDLGNGTILFNATVKDWPFKPDAVMIRYTLDFATWNQEVMKNTSSLNAKSNQYEVLVDLSTTSSPGQRVYYHLVANDSAGNYLNIGDNQPPSSYDSIILTDKSPPLVTVIVSQDPDKEGIVTFQATASDSWGTLSSNPLKLNLTIDQQTTLTVEMELLFGNLWEYVVIFPYNTTVNATAFIDDTAGNVGSHAIFLIIEDKVAPTISVESSILPSGTLSVIVTASESSFGSGIENVTLNGLPMLFNETHYLANITGLQHLQEVVGTITAWDKAGNSATTPLSEIYRDLTPPIIREYGHQDFGNGTILFYANASDDLGVINSLTFGYVITTGDTGTNASVLTLDAAYNGSLWIATVNLRWNFLINYTVLSVEDGALQANTSLKGDFSHSFVVTDLINPSVAFSSITDNQNGSLTVTITANDHNQFQSGIATVKLFYLLNDQPTEKEVQVLKSIGDTWTFLITSLQYNEHVTVKALVVDLANNSITISKNYQLKDLTPPVVLAAGVDDLNNGTLIFWAVVEDYGGGIAAVFLLYRTIIGNSHNSASILQLQRQSGSSLITSSLQPFQVDSLEGWNNETMGYNGTHYQVKVHVKPGEQVEWRIITKDFSGNTNLEAFTPSLPYRANIVEELPIALLAAFMVIVIIGATALAVKFRRREVIGIDKEKVRKHTKEIDQLTIAQQLNEYSLGVIIAYFDQQQGPIPVIIDPEILGDNMNIMLTLADRSFSVTGFAEPEDKLQVEFDFKISGIQLKVISWALAKLNPAARGGKENFTVNLLIPLEHWGLVKFYLPELEAIIDAINEFIQNENLMIKEETKQALTTQHVRMLREELTRYCMVTREFYSEEQIEEFAQGSAASNAS